MLSPLNIAFFILVLGFVYGQMGRGACPPLPDVGICDLTCYDDRYCPGGLKCCPTACGGTFCTKAITTTKFDGQEKPGNCPFSPAGPWVCSSRCRYDSDCRGSKKCCRNRCGAMACTKPEL